jgi:Carboxypeptidase regulatory-like domain
MQTWPLVASLVTIAITAQRLSAQTPLVSDPPKFARISGTAMDAQDAEPLSHVVVCFVLDRNGYYDGTNDYCDETNERGSFRVADLPAGRYGYRVEREGYIAAEPMTDNLAGAVSLSAGDELRDIKFRMQRAGVITGRVVYADGEPFSGATLTVMRGGRATTNDLGEYRIANLSPGDYSVHV